LGSQFLKLRYKRFKDAAMKDPWPEEPQLGMLGFLFHAQVGDSVRATLRNDAPVTVSLHPHGVAYNKSNEGMASPDELPGETADDAIAPGSTFVYEWTVPERSGPGQGDSTSSVAWLVHSHVHEKADINAGLVGVLVVTRQGWADADGKPVDVDREFAMVWSIVDEGASRVARSSMRWSLERAAAAGPNGTEANSSAPALAQQPSRNLHSDMVVDTDEPVDPLDPATAALLTALDDPEARMGMRMHAVNGRLFGSLPGLEMETGERVRWYSIAPGDEQDLHTPHWHGATLTTSSRQRVDTVTLLPATHVVADMVPDMLGTYLVHCHVDHHMLMGMAAKFTVKPCSSGRVPSTGAWCRQAGIHQPKTPTSAAEAGGQGQLAYSQLLDTYILELVVAGFLFVASLVGVILLGRAQTRAQAAQGD
jgi:FtsP/CotA-like multicopper oxidase with cupredoxin domain